MREIKKKIYRKKFDSRQQQKKYWPLHNTKQTHRQNNINYTVSI